MNRFLNPVFKSNPQALFLILLLGSSFFIGIGQTHLFDWDEINFAESAREMLISGDYLLVQINYQSFWEKPPLFFWLQVLSMKIFGVNEFAARLPNALFGILSLVSVYLIGKKHYSIKMGLLWGLLLYASILPHLYFKSGIIDPVFNFFIFLSVYFLYLSFRLREKRNKLAMFAGIFSGLSFLTKGPVGFLLLMLTFISVFIFYRRSIKVYLLQILFFGIGFIALISIWITAELLQNGTENLIKFIHYQINLFSADVAGHKQPFYYHFLVVFIGCFPISILVIPQLFREKKNTTHSFSIWMKSLFWVVMILFSITTTKIVHYSSMTYIPLAFLAALAVNKHSENSPTYKPWHVTLILIMGTFWSLVLFALPLFLFFKNELIYLINDPFAQANFGRSIQINALDFFGPLTFILTFVVSIFWIKRKEIQNAILLYVLGIGLSLNFINLQILPKIEYLSQGAAIEFYKEMQTVDVYLQTLGFKSYAHYFYGQVRPQNQQSTNLNYLLSGEIDKPVILVTKIQNTRLDTIPSFNLMEVRGGFKFYKRDIID